MVSEDEEDDDTAGDVYGTDSRSSAEYQRRLWGAEPGRRDDVLPFFVWSIVHDHHRSEVGLKAFLDVSLGGWTGFLLSAVAVFLIIANC